MSDATTTTTDPVVIPPAEGTADPSILATAAEPKAGDAPAVPEKYDLKLPEGVELASEAVDKVAATARELGLSNEAAQKLLEHEVGIRNDIAKQASDAALAKQAETHKAAVAKWAEASKADAEIAGSIGAIQAARDKFASPELVKLMDDTGFGNHPLVLKLFATIGKAMAEDTVHSGGPATGAPKSLAEVLYGSKS